MSLIPRSFIDELLMRADIVSVVESCLSLKKQGNNYVGLCPFHQEKTPSFMVSPTKQIYHCFGCGAGGNVIGFVMAYERIHFVEAVEWLANRLGLPIPKEFDEKTTKHISQKKSQSLYTFMEQAAKFYEKELQKNPASSRARDYLISRGLDDHVIHQFHLGYAPPGWNHLKSVFRYDDLLKKQLVSAGLLIENGKGDIYDRFRDRVIFPIQNRWGKIVGFGGRVMNNQDTPKYLNSPETPIFHKGKILYGFYEALQTRPKKLLVVEGYMDVIALAQHGIPYAVATLGTATTSDHIRLLFQSVSEVIFCFDGDEAGKTAAFRALEVMVPVLQDGWHARFMFLPSSDDPDSIIRKEGKIAFEKRISEAQSLSQILLESPLKKFNMNTFEGRAGFGRNLLGIVAKIQAPFLKALLLKEIEQRIRIPINQLEEMSVARGKNNSGRLEQSEMISTNKKLSIPEILTAFLLQYPELVLDLDQNFLILAEKEKGLLHNMISFMQNKKNCTTAIIIEHFRDTPNEVQLIQLANHEFLISRDNVKIEFQAWQNKMVNNDREILIENLLGKAATSSLTDKERAQLNDWLKEKK